MHGVSVWTVKPTCDIWPIMRWYSLMGVAICLEDLVKSIYSWVRGGQRERDKVLNGWRKVFGYVWVWVYLGWSLPKVVFPRIECME